MKYLLAILLTGSVLAQGPVPITKTSTILEPATNAVLVLDIRTNRLAVVSMIDLVSTNIADAQAITVSGTSNSNQVRAAVIDLRRELIDSNQRTKDLAQELRELQRIVREIIKGTD